MKYFFLGLRIVLALVFLAAGGAKLAGVEAMVEVFDIVGFGQWLRYVTGAIEVGSVLLLWIPGCQAIGAALLVSTMIGAVLAHLLFIGPSIIPALVLGVLSATVFYHYRSQINLLINRKIH